MSDSKQAFFEPLPLPKGYDKTTPQHPGDPITIPEGDDERLIKLGEGFKGQKGIFFAAVQMTRMPMILTDPNLPDNPIIFANTAFVELTGYSVDEVVGRNCRFLQGPNSDSEIISEVREAISHATDVAVEVLNYRKDGSSFWNALFVSPVFDDHGKLVYFFASQLDCSRRHDAEEALRQAQKMEAVGQLTGGIAHDFNNLLTIIMGSLSRVIDPDLNNNLTENQMRALSRAMEGCHRAEKLTSQLLTFARRQRLEAREVNLNMLARNMRDLASPTMISSTGEHIDINLDLAPDMWIADIDVVQSETAILNIIFNARDSMPNGGSILISTRNEQVPESPTNSLVPGPYAVLSIKDTGCGIAPEIISRVTEPFFTTKDVGKGTGMGLAMVYGFMRQSRGQLVINSTVGVGTTMELYFPVKASSITKVKRARPEIAGTRGPRGGTETILLVEDNAEVMEIAEGVLQDFGYRVLSAANAIEALKIVKAEGAKIDLLFSDIQMPGGMNGVALAQEVTKIDSNIKVLLTTGYSLDQATSSKRSGYEVVAKPYMPSTLGHKIRHILDGPNGLE